MGFHRTIQRTASGVENKNLRTDLSKAHVWGGMGAYFSSKPDIPGYGGFDPAGKNTVVDQPISTKNMETLTLKGSEWLQDTSFGKELRQAIWGGVRGEKGNQPANIRDYVTDMFKKFFPGKNVIRVPVEGEEGAYTYIVLSDTAYAGKAKIAGHINKMGAFIQRTAANQSGEVSLGAALGMGLIASAAAAAFGASLRTKEQISEVASSIASETISYVTSVGAANVAAGLRSVAGNMQRLGSQTLTAAGIASTAIVSAAKAAPAAIVTTAKAAWAGLTTEVSVGAAGTTAVTVGAFVAAAGSVALVGTSAYAAAKGREDPIDVADKFYGTHFGNIYGWVTGVYSKR